MIAWDAPANPPSTPFCAIACKLNPGVLDDQGNMIVRPGQIYVDDTMLASDEQPAIEAVLASITEAIFIVMGEPNEQFQQFPLAMDK